MKNDTPEPLDPELRNMLDIEADFPPEDAALSDRVWRKVELAIVPVPSGGGDGGGGAVPGAGTTSTPPTISTVPKYLTVAVLAFIAGGFAGAGLLHSLTPRAAVPTAAEIAAPPTLPSPEPAPSVEAVPLPEVKEAPAAAAAPPVSALPHPSASAKSSPASTSDLARERAIIEVARTAVSRERYSAALEAIDRHAREFPKGQLAEEREGLRVIALARSGQSNEAGERATAFKKRYPQSVLLPATEAAATDSKSKR